MKTCEKEKIQDLKNFVFDLQRFASDPEGGSGEGGEGSATGEGATLSGKFKEIKDPETGKTVKIPLEMDALIGHVISSTRKREEEKYKPIISRIETLESENKEFVDVKAELERLREASMTAEQIAQKNAETKIKEHEKTAKKAVEEGGAWKNLFFDSTIRNDIFAAFSNLPTGVTLFNADQTRYILEREGQARVEEVIDDEGHPTGKFETRLTLELENDKGVKEKVEGTPGALFMKWVNQERNLHHLANRLNSGGGSQQQRSARTGTMKQSFDEIADPVERMKSARRARVK